jgi:hypothetical protein
MNARVVSFVFVTVAAMFASSVIADDKRDTANNQPVNVPGVNTAAIPGVGRLEVDKSLNGTTLHGTGAVSPQATFSSEPRTMENREGVTNISGGVRIEIPEHRAKEAPAPTSAPVAAPQTAPAPSHERLGPEPGGSHDSSSHDRSGPADHPSSDHGRSHDYTGPDHASGAAQHTV